MLDANRKEKEISDLNAECDALEAAEDWKQALDQLQAERDELVEVLAERDLQLQDLERKLDEMDQLAHQDEAELKKAIARVADKDHEVSRLGEEVVGMAEGLQEACHLSIAVRAMADSTILFPAGWPESGAHRPDCSERRQDPRPGERTRSDRQRSDQQAKYP